MILSVSRRTDIPNYYAEWFMNRIREGFLYVRNPMNAHQISRIRLTPDTIDCIVFWTKNPVGMMEYLDELRDYQYYFQFTLTGYGQDIEKHIPDKKKVMIPRFQELSQRIGKERVIWRYDPIMFTERYTKEYHLNAFRQIAESLNGYTEKCVISFVDTYRKNKIFLSESADCLRSQEELMEFASELQKTAQKNGMKMGSCSEKIDLASCGIEHNCCIDQALIEQLTGDHLNVKKDGNQRLECGCVESVEVGAYNTCANGCAYCYATYDERGVAARRKEFDVRAPLLCGRLMEGDKVSERKVKSIRDGQLRLEDLWSTDTEER